MTKSLLLKLTIVVSAACTGYAQQCELRDLSKKFNFQITAVRIKDADGAPEISALRVRVINRANKKRIQRISVAPGYLYQNTFTKCAAAARSYVTGKRKNAEAVDNDYGDFVVADFNFDGREDFAVKRDSGGNGGAFYEYYTQHKTGAFRKDAFLTDVIGYFPGTIDWRRKRLITYIHANAFGYNENIYKYNSAAKKWTFFRQTYRPAGK